MDFRGVPLNKYKEKKAVKAKKAYHISQNGPKATKDVVDLDDDLNKTVDEWINQDQEAATNEKSGEMLVGTKPKASLYVSNIPQKMTETGLANYFGQFGTVLQAAFAPRFKVNPLGNSMKKFGFLDMGLEDEARVVMAKCSDSPPFFMSIRWKKEDSDGNCKMIDVIKEEILKDDRNSDWDEGQPEPRLDHRMDEAEQDEGEVINVEEQHNDDDDVDLTEEEMSKLSSVTFGSNDPLTLPADHFVGHVCANWCLKEAKLEFKNSKYCSIKCFNEDVKEEKSKQNGNAVNDPLQ